MVKILYIGGVNANEKGAVGTHTSGIIEAFNEHPLVKLSGIFYKKALPNTLPTQSFLYQNYLRSSNYLSRITESIFYFPFVKNKIHKINPEYIYLRFDPISYPLIFLASHKKRIILEYNDIFYDQIVFAASKGNWSRFGRMIRLSLPYKKTIKSIEKFAFKNSHLNVVVTDGLYHYCKSIAPNANVLTVKNATNIFQSSEYPLNDNTLHLSHIGTLTYWDGLEELIKSLHIAKNYRSDFNFNLQVIGDGSLKDSLIKLVDELNLNEYIHFSKSMPHKEAIKLLQKTDVVPLLKTIDGYGLSPIKFYEALGSGCYLLSSNIPHINELPPFAGSTVPFPLDLEIIAEELINIYDNLAEIRKNRNNIVDYAKENHSWNSRVSTIIEGLH